MNNTFTNIFRPNETEEIKQLKKWTGLKYGQ